MSGWKQAFSLTPSIATLAGWQLPSKDLTTLLSKASSTSEVQKT